MKLCDPQKPQVTFDESRSPFVLWSRQLVPRTQNEHIQDSFQDYQYTLRRTGYKILGQDNIAWRSPSMHLESV